MDPQGNFIAFVRKDIVSNIDIHRDSVHRIDDLNARKEFPAVGLMKKTASAQEIANKQIHSARLPTDHISFEPPESTWKFQKVYDSMLTSPKYSTNFETGKEGWMPKNQLKTVCNKSSVPYNIIAHSSNIYSGSEMVGVLDKKVTNRKKGVVEFSDLTRVSALKMNERYNSMYQVDSTMFRKKTGIFTFMYDAAVRNGKISLPFSKAAPHLPK
jgi:hypothetical protein